ncbi:synaptobrevin homolog YKT6 [Caerostris extrusa]|uniref:Synaptobrevin homolog YKT6 n=1 Tax=Caerostris extrusa TaxID=172846 RepID=A0AAV4MMW1_CAEEX|nr:synaptobrevin homolog YKT6 [Caerostris extrusa]
MYYLAVIRKQSLKGAILSSCSDFSSFGFFQKKSAREFMRFSSLMLVGRTEPDTKISVREQTYVCHAFVQSNRLAAAAVTDDEYPPNVVHICLSQLLSDFESYLPPRIWKRAEDTVEFPGINVIFEKYSSPKNLDLVTTTQGQIDETKIILHQTLESILQRGEKLDELVNKADDLSLQAKTFYKSAREV